MVWGCWDPHRDVKGWGVDPQVRLQVDTEIWQPLSRQIYTGIREPIRDTIIKQLWRFEQE